MRRGCLRWYSFYDEFSHLFLVPPKSPPPTKTIGKVALHSCPSVSGSHLWMCISYRLKGQCLSKGEVLVMASEKINDSSSQKCPTVGSSTWWCSRCPCLGAFCPSLYALLTSWRSALLWWGCRHTHDHNSIEETLAAASPVMVSPRHTSSSLSPNMCHYLSVSLFPLLQPVLCKQHSGRAKLQLTLSISHWAKMTHCLPVPVLLFRKCLRCFSGLVWGAFPICVCFTKSLEVNYRLSID